GEEGSARTGGRGRSPARGEGADRRDRADARGGKEPGNSDPARADAARGGEGSLMARGISSRHSRAVLFPGIGEKGQERVQAFSIVFIGVGSGGAAAAEAAARAGGGGVALLGRAVVAESKLAPPVPFHAH